MATQFEDVISALCTESSQSHANEFQRVFALSTPLEAKLVFEVLVASGFDVKVYHQAGQPSKLYISNPTIAPDKLEHQLASALVYAKALKQIKVNINSLCSDNEALISSLDYNIAFVNTQPNGKQILIQLNPSASAESAAQQADDDQPDAGTTSAPASAAAATGQPRYKYGQKPKGHYEELSSGPAVGRGNYPGRLNPEGEAQQNSLKRRTMLYLFGNMATSSFALFLMIVFLGVVFSVLVFARAIVCPDFAVANQNKAWYCKIGKEDENQKQKQKQQQQQQQQSQPLLQQPTPVAPR
jgi:hypothetical protein